MSDEIEKRIAGVSRLTLHEGFDFTRLVEDESGGLCAWEDFEALRRAFKKRGEQVEVYRRKWVEEKQKTDVPPPDSSWARSDDAEVLAAWDSNHDPAKSNTYETK